MPRIFVISSQPRSGTHLISTSLRVHPDITCFGELFGNNQPRWTPDQDPHEFLARWLDQNASAAVLGFTIHSTQLRQPRVAEAIAKLRPSVIQLRRVQILEAICSRMIAKRTQNWSEVVTAPRRRQHRRLTIMPASAEREFRQYANRTVRDRRGWVEAGCPLLELTYETMCQRYEEAMDAAQRFLGVTPRAITPTTRKQETRPPSAIIRNYQELAAAMRNTRWAYLFD